MSTVELPYTFSEVRNKEQAQLFIAQVLVPASDLIAGCSFLESGQYEVCREQTVGTRDAPGCWARIGFQAIRLQPIDDPSDILYNLYAHSATDTTQFPFSAKALHAAETLARNKQFGENIIETVLGREIDEYDEIEYVDEVVEQHEYYMNNKSLKPVRDTDFVYTRNGIAVWTDSAETTTVQESEQDLRVDKYQGLLGAEDELNSTFDMFDLKDIAEILRSLGLLAVG